MSSSGVRLASKRELASSRPTLHVDLSARSPFIDAIIPTRITRRTFPFAVRNARTAKTFELTSRKEERGGVDASLLTGYLTVSFSSLQVHLLRWSMGGKLIVVRSPSRN